MKASEFTDKAEKLGYCDCEDCGGILVKLAASLVEAGVLEADDNPQQQPRRVEVEGVEVKGPDADGDLVIRGAWEGTTYVAHSNAGQAARALLAWVAAGEPKQEARAAPGPLLREEGGSFASVTVEGDDGCNPTRLAFRRHTGESGWIVFGDHGGPFVTDKTYRRMPVAALAELAAHFCPPQPQAAPEPAQGTRERPYLWRRKTESGGTEEVPVWLYLDAEGVNLIAGNSAIICLAEDRDRPRLVGCAYNYPGPKDSKGRAEVKVGRFDSDLPQPAAQPQPEAGEVVLRLTREEIRAVRTLLANTYCVGGSKLERAAAAAQNKLAYIPGTEWEHNAVRWDNGAIRIKD